MRTRHVLKGVLLAALSAPMCPAFAADWAVVPDESEVAFVTVKNGRVAEAHTFQRVGGRIDDDGRAIIEIELASVDTGIPIRDERMRTLLFAVDRYPQAVMRAPIDLDAFEGLAPGESVAARLEGTLTLHGQDAPLTAEVWVTRLGSDKVRVSTRRPVIVDADSFGLTGGIEALRAVAGLASITPAVPVSFNITLAEQD